MGGHELGEEHGLGGELPRTRVVGLAPVQRVRAVDRLQHRRQAFRPLRRLRLLEPQAGRADLRLGADQALGHRLRLHQERARDAGGVEAEHGLQHQRAVDARVDRGVGADEHQPQPAVGQRRRVGRGLVFAGPQHRERRIVGQPLAARRHQQPTAGGRQQPRVGRHRHAVERPAFERRGEGVGQGVFRGRDVAPLPRQPREQPAVAVPRRRLGRRRRVVAHLAGDGILRTGQTSVAPTAEPGQRSAHFSASSSESTSTTA